MPELPEVETIKRGLEKEIINKRIIETQVKLPRLIKIPEADEFITRLTGVLAKNIGRRGKYIIIFLNTMDYLVIHLGMSGRLIYQEEKLPLLKIDEKHNHLLFFFEDGSKMIYNDVRTFGKIWLLKKDEKLSGIESKLCFSKSKIRNHRFHGLHGFFISPPTISTLLIYLFTNLKQWQLPRLGLFVPPPLGSPRCQLRGFFLMARHAQSSQIIQN